MVQYPVLQKVRAYQAEEDIPLLFWWSSGKPRSKWHARSLVEVRWIYFCLSFASCLWPRHAASVPGKRVIKASSVLRALDVSPNSV